MNRPGAGAAPEEPTAGEVAPRVGVVLLIWTLVALFFLTRTYLISLFARGTPLQLLDAVAALADSYQWALYTFPILALARRFPLRRGAVRRSLPVHLLAGLAVAGAAVATNWLVARALWGDDVLPLPRYFALTYHWSVQWYWIIVGVAHLMAYHRAIRDRDLRSSKLEAQLARAQLDALKTQIQPHFLFNTLNTISEVMHRDVDAADRMMAQLGHLLRLGFEQSGAQGIPLAQELDFLRAYLGIQRARFHDRLTVEWEVDPAALRAEIPTLILQPLVENAIQHGLAPRAGSGSVAIRARRTGDRLLLEVQDDGPGIAFRPGGARAGVGLGNTRARLRQIYGEAHRFHLARHPGGGTIARLDLPFRSLGEDPRPAAAPVAVELP